MSDRPRKRPRDPNELAKVVIGVATGQESDPLSWGLRKGTRRPWGGLGLKGGRAIAERLSPKKAIRDRPESRGGTLAET